ncbi:MAG: hypothetical protein P8183_08525 [Anaerolineae bacterium]
MIKSLPSAKWRRITAVLLPLLLTIVVALATLELGLRHFYQLIPLDVCASDNIFGTYYCQPYFVYDKPIRIGYRFKPNLHIETMWDPADPHMAGAADETAPSDRSDAFLYLFETDEMGFPNSEPTWRDSYDIVVTGDSFVTRSAPKTWIELLREQTGRRILTLGANSWSTLNELEAVKMYGLDKNPKWVILLFFEGNDVINTAQYLERRDSGLDWREYDMQGVAWQRRLVIWQMAHYYLNGKKSQSVPAHYRYPVTVSTEAGPIQTVFKQVHLLPLSADYDTLAHSDEFKTVAAALVELKQLVEAQNGRFLLVYVPSKEHVTWSRIWGETDVNNILERTVTVSLSEGDHGALQWSPIYLDYQTFNENHNAQERLFSDFARENDIEFLNLTPALWQMTIEQGEMYNYADPHWNQAGNQLAADLIQNYLQTAEEGGSGN